jgi:hypothetical protein
MGFSQQWHAVGREAELAGSQIALGVTALGRANHSRLGDYTMAFFGLATGLERMGKLIAIGDHAIAHRGQFPDNDFLKQPHCWMPRSEVADRIGKKGIHRCAAKNQSRCFPLRRE